MENNWNAPAPVQIGQTNYECAYCGTLVGPNMAFTGVENSVRRPIQIRICPNCTQPTYFDAWDSQTPAPRMGRDVKGINDVGVENLYREARDCTSVKAFTATALLCRKILMNMAVQNGAKPDGSFAFYVDFLNDNHYVPVRGKTWVDKIRVKGNEAAHEIPSITEEDAKQVMQFVEMLLRFNYELPESVTPGPDSVNPTGVLEEVDSEAPGA